jgi:hypothetical protein
MKHYHACIVALSLAGTMNGFAADTVQEALRSVRNINADIFEQPSSVFGKYPSAEEMREMSMWLCPVPRFSPDPRATVVIPAKRIAQLAGEAGARMAEADKDISKGAKPEDRLKRWASVIPLGITGAALLKDYLDRQDVMVFMTLPGTPADGKLVARDIIVGANGVACSDPEDPRPLLGYALAASQSPEFGGKITFHVIRNGALTNVTIDLGCTISYSKTFPYNCEKTKKMREATLKFVLKTIRTGNGKGGKCDLFDIHSGGGFWTPLFLMASGDKEAMDVVRDWVRSTTEAHYAIPAKSENTWVRGYELINVAEYYLLTKDPVVLPRIQYLVRMMEKNEFTSGGWSHGAAGGYGEINNVGLAALTGLALAGKCDGKIQIDQEKLALAIRYFGRFCGRNLPYGNANPSGRAGRMDNGMNGLSAIAFHLLGEDKMAERWAKTACYMWLARDAGHAEALFNMSLGTVGGVYAPPPEFNALMQHLIWYYELCRTPEGGMVFLRGSHFQYAGAMTPAMALILYLPERRLQIFGPSSLIPAATK